MCRSTACHASAAVNLGISTIVSPENSPASEAIWAYPWISGTVTSLTRPGFSRPLRDGVHSSGSSSPVT